MDNEIIIQFITTSGTVFITILGHYFKTRSDIKKSTKENLIEHKKLFEELKDLKLSINKIEEKQDFSKELFDEITREGISIIKNNIDLDSKITRLLNNTLSKIRGFALKHLNSAYRTTKKDLKDYISIEVACIYDEIDALANDLFFDRTFRGVKYVYSDFVKEFTDLDIIVRVMKKKLIENGLSNSEYKKLFIKFIEELILEQIRGWRMWTGKRSD